MVTVTKYGLRHKVSNRLLGVSLQSNDGQSFCVSTTTTLNDYSEDIWLVDTPINAEYVRQFSTEWYNACHETPSHSFKPEELEVIKIEITTIEEKIEVKIPTFEKFLKMKYKKKDPIHYKYITDELKSNRNVDRKYSLYDLEELQSKGLL